MTSLLAGLATCAPSVHTSPVYLSRIGVESCACHRYEAESWAFLENTDRRRTVGHLRN